MSASSSPSFLAWPGAAFAIGAAVLFGASTPFAKVLLGHGLSPQLLAGLFYLGSGVGLSGVLIVRLLLKRGAGEASLRLADVPQLASAVLLGGAVAPSGNRKLTPYLSRCSHGRLGRYPIV